MHFKKSVFFGKVLYLLENFFCPKMQKKEKKKRLFPLKCKRNFKTFVLNNEKKKKSEKIYLKAN